MFRPTLLAVLLCFPITYVEAQLLKYSNNQEILGAASVSPSSTRQIIERLVQACSQHGDDIRRKGDQALQGWLKQHQELIDENAKIKQEIFDLTKTELQKQQFNQFYDVQFPKMVDAQFKAFSSAIDAMPTRDTKAQVCAEYMRSVEDGKWNLKTNDPVVFSFLQDRIAARVKNEKLDTH